MFIHQLPEHVFTYMLVAMQLKTDIGHLNFANLVTYYLMDIYLNGCAECFKSLIRAAVFTWAHFYLLVLIISKVNCFVQCIWCNRLWHETAKILRKLNYLVCYLCTFEISKGDNFINDPMPDHVLNGLPEYTKVLVSNYTMTI